MKLGVGAVKNYTYGGYDPEVVGTENEVQLWMWNDLKENPTMDEYDYKFTEVRVLNLND